MNKQALGANATAGGLELPTACSFGAPSPAPTYSPPRSTPLGSRSLPRPGPPVRTLSAATPGPGGSRSGCGGAVFGESELALTDGLARRAAGGWTAALVADEAATPTDRSDEAAGRVGAACTSPQAGTDDGPTGPIPVAVAHPANGPGGATASPRSADLAAGEEVVPSAPRRTEEFGPGFLLRPARRPPRSGWRRLVYRLSGPVWNLGESEADATRRELTGRVAQPIRGDVKIAVVALKGGVGKTVTTATLGATLASARGDHVIAVDAVDAVDANPDRANLGTRVGSQTTATVRDLLSQAETITRVTDVRAFTSQAPSRLEVLASERDPGEAEAFSEADYRAAVAVLERFYTVILADCGTGLTHAAMGGVLGTADAVILVCSPALDGAQAADATVSWLQAQGYGHLVDRAVVVISASRPGTAAVSVPQLVEHFEARLRAVRVIPFDAHLAQGAEIDLDRVSAPVREAFLDLAAVVADDFAAAAGGPSLRGGRDG